MNNHSPIKSKALAVIDQGSNTSILLIFAPQLPLKVIHEEFRIPRLAEGLRPGGEFTSAARQRTIAALQEFAALCKSYNAELVCCGGTAPFRKVKNPLAAIDDFKRQSGILVRPLSEEEEAYSAFLSAVDLHDTAASTVLDIGGGSCELAWGNGVKMLGFYSHPIGCVDCTEKWLPGELQENGTTSADALAVANREIAKLLPLQPVMTPSRFYAVAGTPVSLALLEKGHRRYEPHIADGTVVGLSRLGYWKNKMATTSLQKKINHYGIPRGRAEVILTGLIILETIMQQYGFDEVVVRNAGLRYGLALQALTARQDTAN